MTVEITCTEAEFYGVTRESALGRAWDVFEAKDTTK
jgi:hypothetical protein